MITIIVATDENGLIGSNNNIPWKNSEDLRFFKETTQHNNVLMGRKTFNSLNNKPLKNRNNYIVSKSLVNAEGVQVFSDILGAVNDAKNNGKEIFIIGGETIYNQSLKLGIVNKIIKSIIPGTYSGDKWFNVPNNYQLTQEINKETFSIQIYNINN